MSYKELGFNSQHQTFASSEVTEVFRMHFDLGCRYVAKSA